MENFEQKDIENCYVCSEYMGAFKSDLTEVCGYSEKPIVEILGKFFLSAWSRMFFLTFTSI